MDLLAIENLSVSFGGIKAVDGASFTVQKGEVFSVIGPNGAGKTTVFNLISRIFDVDGGRIVFDGSDITRERPYRIADLGIARTFQNINLFENGTVLENLMLGRYRHDRTALWQQMLFTPAVRREKRADRAKVEEIIELLELEKYRDSRIDGLAYGVRKVVEIGRALATAPSLLLLDEPSSGLNAEETNDLTFWIEDIKEDLGVTILMIEHDMSLVTSVSDRVMAMNAGRVLALGTSAEIQANQDVIAAYLGE
ncbi:MAG: ABC transporter ATP-binding protein [Stellaceae bacterium]